MRTTSFETVTRSEPILVGHPLTQMPNCVPGLHLNHYWDVSAIPSLGNRKEMTDCRLEYMAHNPGVVGSSPAGATENLLRRSSMVEHRKSL